MATVEKNALLCVKDTGGDLVLLYPATNSDSVMCEGDLTLTEKLEEMESGGSLDDIQQQLAALSATVSTLQQQMVSIDKVYPVGSIYMSYNSTSPQTLFGGTWTQLTNRFLIGAGSSYSLGETGGAATVTLTENQMPSHSHQPNFSTSILGTTGSVTRRNAASGSGVSNVITSANAFEYVTVYSTTRAGGGGSHNNMPPYMAVYMWRRTG